MSERLVYVPFPPCFVPSELLVVPRESLVVLPSSPTDHATSAVFFFCSVEANLTNFTTVWTTPNDASITVDGVFNTIGSAGSSDDKFVAVSYVTTVVNETMFEQSESLLGVKMLSYLDAGNYMCTLNVTDGEESGSIGSATVELILLCRFLWHLD